MDKFYTDEKNVQILVALLKAHGIKNVVASPGSANSPLVASLQYDDDFDVYSSVDERSAGYIACGLAEETGEAVVITCTGATASRNYLSGLTEAYYRKLPILAITSTQPICRIGHHAAQVIDRSVLPNDVAKLSVTLPIIKDHLDSWACGIEINRAILELSRRGGGPAHINLQTDSKSTYTTKELPDVRRVQRIAELDLFPELPACKVAVFAGAHQRWSQELTQAVDGFCSSNNSVVFCDHTSGYKGKYKLNYALAACQKNPAKMSHQPDLLIHIGEVSGDYPSLGISAKSEVWRVNPDGEVRDTFRKLTKVFEMPLATFFSYYCDGSSNPDSYLSECKSNLSGIRNALPELPLSNIWIASMMAQRIPDSSVIHFAILNSLRSWNFFELPESVRSASNVGGFGIDGVLSSLVGASLADINKLYFCVIGDLAFFYDMNVMGNRHVGKNLRILIVNNGRGTEFRQYDHHTSHFGDDADSYIAAAGHFGNKSPSLVKNYAQDLGFEYLTASNKDEFEAVYERFLNPELTGRPIVFEVFTDSEEESKALEKIMNIEANIKSKTKGLAKQVLGKKSLNLIRKIAK